MIIDNKHMVRKPRPAGRRGERLRVGIAGAGWVTQFHLPAWRAEALRAEVVAIADPDPERRESRRGQHDLATGYASAAAMLADADLDILDICAPREAHVGLVRSALERGIAVLCQKPLAPSLGEAEALAATIEADAPLMVHDNWRFRATYRLIKQWLDADVAGTLRRVELSYLSSGMIPDGTGSRPALVRQPNFPTIRRLLVMEALIHQLDALRFLLGELDLLDARLARSSDAIIGEDSATLTLRRREDGLPVELVGNLAAHGEPPQARDQLRIFGGEGTIALDGYRVTCAGKLTHDEQFDADRVYQGSYEAAIGHFLDCLQTGAPFETSVADNLRTLALVEGAYKCADIHAALPARYAPSSQIRRNL